MPRFSPVLLSLFLVGCPWIPADVHDEFDDDEDSDTLDIDDDTEPCEAEELYADGDEDGYGGAAVDACDPPPRTAAVGGDCNDADFFINPGAAEVCDGVDNDCNTATTESSLATLTNAVSGERFDLTADLANFAIWAPPTAMSHGVLDLCSGEFTTTLVVQTPGQRLDIIGHGDVVLAPGASSDRTLYVDDAEISVSQLTLAGGTRSDGGGAILCSDSALDLADVDILGGTAPIGGGLYATGCDLYAFNTVWNGQSTPASGDASYFFFQGSSTADVQQSTFSGSTGRTGITIADSALTMTDTAFSYGTSIGIEVGSGGQFTATGVDFPTWTGSDVVAGTTSLNLGADFSGFCNANGCVAR